MTRPAQKERELKAVEALRQLDSRFPQGAVEPSEEPLDVIVKLAVGGCVGIEVRDFVRDETAAGSPLNAFEVVAAKVAHAAKAAYDALGARPLWASLSFDPKFRCRTADISAVAGSIATEVARAASDPLSPSELYRWQVPALPENLNSITLLYPPSMMESEFSVMHTGAYTDILPSQIDAILEDKGSKLPSYRAKCGEIWLLLVANGFKMSAWSELSEAVAQQEFKTDFDRVLMLFDTTRLVELRISP
ncbi:MAG TPA: hypothetical protein VF787_13420 [Thermoanaerobaculia bacterium]